MLNDPAHLLDGNIFYPATKTLLFSDAMLAPAALGAPFIWAGVHQATVHNVLLFAALLLSALTCYLLCRDLAGDRTAAIIGGIVFTLAPFRIGHIGHLELQWAPFMPLMLLLLHRASRLPSATPLRTGTAAGALLALQGYSSLYYMAFFALFLVAWSALAFLDAARAERRRFAMVLVTAAAVSGLFLAPYLATYAGARQTLGSRSASEIREHSATAGDYFKVSGESETYTRADLAGEEERSLFPGVTAVALALCALALGRGRMRWIYAALLVLSVDLSLGANGVTYPIVMRLLPFFSSFRAPARYGILVLLTLAVLSSMGLAAIRARLAPRARNLVTAVLVAACLAEYWVAPIATMRQPLAPPAVYRWLAAQRGLVILELPVPDPSALWLFEATYEYWSTFHWNTLVNGYSGNATVPYVRLLELLREREPDAIARHLGSLGVDYLILHEQHYGPAAFADALRFYGSLPGAGTPLSFNDPDDPAVVIPLR